MKYKNNNMETFSLHEPIIGGRTRTAARRCGVAKALQGHCPVHGAKVVTMHRHGYLGGEHLHRSAVIDTRSYKILRYMNGYYSSARQTSSRSTINAVKG
jgi:hypothetical protein